MTRNSKQCPNWLASHKYDDWFYTRFKKSATDKQTDKALRKKGFRNCWHSSGMVRLYIRKIQHNADQWTKKYQKLVAFGWFCPGCKQVFLDVDLEKHKVGKFHGPHSVDDY